uniref:Glycerophosphodiester phosphodiesterase domain containing 1 n=1 Tax=Eptatretus burgeri TaxID=7764 RepID=A0A8C4QP89_EPTBU
HRLVVATFKLHVKSGKMVPSQPRLDVGQLKDERAAEEFANKLSGDLGGLGTLGDPEEFALNLGADMLELDVRRTNDGQVVVCHDSSLLRTCGKDADIRKLNYNELPRYRSRIPVSFQPGCECMGEDRRIPLLREVFAAFPDVSINIDIKDNDDELISQVSELVREFRREPLTVWGNARHQIVRKCRLENPAIPTLFSARRVLCLVAYYYSGLLPFLPIPEACLEIPVPSMLLMEPGKLPRLNRFLLHAPCVFPQVYLWVLNEEADFKRAFDLGVTGVMTDFPSKLRQFLSAR